jgi:hypothetical protein
MAQGGEAMTDPNILIAASAATGAIIGAVLTAAFRGPRTVYIQSPPVYRDLPFVLPPPAVRESEAAYERRMDLWREQQRRRPRPVDPRSLFPKDIDSRPKLGSMAEAYDAERKQLLQVQRQHPDAPEDQKEAS